jgi:DNA-binding transcriptional LysR family regulator
MLNNITLQQIEIFLTVAEQLNLSEAAKDLFINQSAVSRWILRLEGSLNTQLFTRGNRGVALTEHGEFLYEELKPIYEKLSSTLENIRSVYDMSGNIVRVGCLDSAEVTRALTHASRAFERSGGDTILRIEPMDFKLLREQLLCGNLDVIVAYSLGFGSYWNIEQKKVAKLKTYLALSKHSPLAASSDIPAAALGEETLYLLSLAEFGEAEERAISTCRQIGFMPKEIRYMPSFFALELAIKNNRGFTISGTNIRDRFADDIKLYPVPDPGEEQYVILAWRTRGCAPHVRAFIDSVQGIE